MISVRAEPFGPRPRAASGRQDRIEQLAAVASAYIDRYFEGTPDRSELVKAKTALDAALALADAPPRRYQLRAR